MNIKGKNIVITGGTSGIGLYLAREFTKMGGNVWIVARDQKKLGQIKKSLDNKVQISSHDLKNPNEIDKLFKELFTKTNAWSGKVDIFIANAGFAYYEKFNNCDWNHLQDIYSLNTFSPIYSLGKMVENSDGRVFQYVIIASGVAKYPLPGYSLYSSTKAAIDGFTRAYDFEKNSNIVLSTVYPVALKTSFYKNAGNNVKTPLMRQSMEASTKNIVKGIIENKKYIYPSKIFHIGLFVTPFIPINLIFSYLEKIRLDRWLKK